MKKVFLMMMLMMLGAGQALYAEAKTEYAPNVVVGDGKNGNAWGQWTQEVKEAPVKRVEMRLQRVKGSDKTYVNLRFGRKGTTLDGSKRIYLKDDKEVVVSWNVGGVSPDGKPLVLNAYDGEVKVIKVAVIHQ